MTNKEALNYTEVVKAALEKQIAKIVENIRYMAVSGNISYLLYGYCPICGNHVESDQKYCPECGQKLNWNIHVAATTAHFKDFDELTDVVSISTSDYATKGVTYANAGSN